MERNNPDNDRLTGADLMAGAESVAAILGFFGATLLMAGAAATEAVGAATAPVLNSQFQSFRVGEYGEDDQDASRTA